MTAAESPAIVTVAEPARPPWMDLARIEVRRYAGRPAFLVGLVLTYATLLPYLDGDEPTDELSMIAPAALLGMVGLSVSAHRVWASDRCAEAAGPTPVGQASRTVGHLAACVVPFLAGLGFVLLTVLRAQSVPTVRGGYAEMMSDGWVAAVWFALGAVSCLAALGTILAALYTPDRNTLTAHLSPLPIEPAALRRAAEFSWERYAANCIEAFRRLEGGA